MMDESKPYSSATEEVLSLPQLRQPRHVPDVPDDIDFLMEHLGDPNFDLKKRPISATSYDSYELGAKKAHSDVDAESHYTSEAYSTSRADSRNSTAIDFDDESPYPEVRASVSSVDDPSMPVNTFRMWFLGLFYTIVVSGLNQFFSMRYPSVLITGIVAQLTALPLGQGLARILPTTRLRVLGYSCSLNPGPFNIKEHVCITVMANVVAMGAYATDIIATQKVFYKQEVPTSYQILLVLSSQLVGFSFAGFLRQFVVWPSSMIWPGALVNSALFHTLHQNYGKQEPGHMSRGKFFLIVMAGSFAWFFLPGYLFTALSVFNWVCWIAPNNTAVNALFGTASGVGLSAVTLDWSMIAYIGSPLVVPWWSTLNTTTGFVLFFWILTPALYFSNAWFTKFMPISTSQLYDNMGLPYDPTLIMTNGTFDAEKYHAYSPLYMSAALAVAYGIAFASFAAVVVHTLLWFRRDIVRRFRRSLRDERDVHSRLMQAYPEVPLWWFAIIGIVSIALLLTAIEIYPTQLPIWGALFALFLAAILCIPLGMLQAITNQQITLQVMHQLIAGYIWPGRPVANMIFKCVAFIGTNQAVGFAADLKLGHYMKIPPRTMFMVQTVAAVVSCFVVTFVQQWMFANIPDFCARDQKDGFMCPSTNTFGSASIIWGGVGPARIFSPGAMYSPLLWFFMIGAIAPVPFYFLARRFPLSIARYVNIPVFLAGLGAIPPANGINYASWCIVGFIFNYLVRRYHLRWWMRYNYILSAGLDAGVALSLIIIFFTLQLPKGGVNVNWWGNTVWMNTADANGIPMLVPEEGGIFGPSEWK